MKIALTAFDMDGTLLDEKKQLPAAFPDWVRAHPEIIKVIASGRQYDTLRDNMGSLQDLMFYVAENGALVYEGKTLLYCDEIAAADVRYCAQRLRQMEGVHPMFCGAQGAYICGTTPKQVRTEAEMYYHNLRYCTDVLAEAMQDQIVKIAIYVEAHRVEEAAEAFADLPPQLAVVISGDSWIDIANRSANKGAGIAVIQKKYRISPAACMAFGDYLNDVALLQSCQESYCMENGHPELKKLARHIAPPNTVNGVMRVLQRVLD